MPAAGKKTHQLSNARIEIQPNRTLELLQRTKSEKYIIVFISVSREKVLYCQNSALRDRGT